MKVPYLEVIMAIAMWLCVCMFIMSETLLKGYHYPLWPWVQTFPVYLAVKENNRLGEHQLY